MNSQSSYLDYVPSNILQFVGSIVYYPRQEYSTNIAQFLTADIDSIEHNSYRAGLVFLGCVFGGILLIWSFFLVWLKLNASTVGCASGQPFEQGSRALKRSNKDQQRQQSIDRKDSYDRCQSIKRKNDHNLHEAITTTDCSVNGFEEETPSPMLAKTHSNADDSSIATFYYTRSSREIISQIIFLFLGLCILILTPVVIVQSFKPLAETDVNSDVYVVDFHNALDTTKIAFETILTSTDSALNLLNNSFSFKDICSKTDDIEIQRQLGIDLQRMSTLVQTCKVLLTSDVTGNVTDIIQVTSLMEEGIEAFESALNVMDEYSWIIPIFLLGMCSLVLISMFGVLFASRRSSSEKFQDLLSYVLLPFLIVASVICWTIAICLAIATAISSDACMPQSLSGEPKETVLEILVGSGFTPNDAEVEFVTAYVEGCNSNDPTIDIVALKNDLNEMTIYIWQWLSEVDSIDKLKTEQLCSTNENFDRLLSTSRDLAMILTSIKEAFDTTISSLSCNRINQIFDAAVNQSICTDAANAFSFGFIFFLLLGIFTMAMISLRASWRHKLKDDKIYDESEVAENMIVDEHEEYLRYISKYKHEWEEYQGMDADLSDPRVPSSRKDHNENSGSTESLCESESDDTLQRAQNQFGSIENDLASSEDNSIQDYAEVEYGTRQDTFDPYSSTDNQSQSSESTEDSISFFSLKSDIQSKGKTQSTTKKSQYIAPLLSLLNQSPTTDTDEQDEEEIIPIPPHHTLKDAQRLSLSESQLRVDTRSSIYEKDIQPRIKADQYFIRKRGVSPLSPQTNLVNYSNKNRKTEDRQCRDSVGKNHSLYVSQLMQELDEIGGSDSPTFGQYEPDDAPRTNPPPSVSSTVKFQVVDIGPISIVKQHVDRYSKCSKRTNRSSTPPRLQPVKTKELAAKFNSPARNMAPSPRSRFTAT